MSGGSVVTTMSEAAEPAEVAPWPPPPPISTTDGAPPPRLAHEPALDGIRGFAMAVILCYHAAIVDDLPWLHRWSSGGFLSVSAFFTLSGFLITTLLVLEHQATGRISFGRFWSRRFRRLLPALLLTLICVAALAPIVGESAALGSLRAELLSAAGYVINWQSIFTRSDYAATFATAQSPLKHLWSVSIEEQWYLLLPVLVAAVLCLARRSRLMLGVAFGVLAVVSVALSWILGDGHYSNRVYLGTDTRFAEMAIGGLLATATAGRFAPSVAASRPSWVRRIIDLSTFGVFGAGIWLWVTADIRGDFPYRGGLAIHALGVCAVIYAAMHKGTLVNRVLRFTPFASLGKVSYGAYLLHWPILLWLTPKRLHLPAGWTAVVQITLVVVLAQISYRFYEAPIRVGTRVLSWRRIALPVVGASALLMLTVLLPEPDPSRVTALETTDAASVSDLAESNRLVTAGGSDNGLDVSTTTTFGSPVATAPAPPPPVRIMVIGDSFAMSLVPGMRDLAEVRSDFGFLNAALVGCGFGRGGRNRGIGLDVAYSKECRQRDTWLLGALGYYRPDVVVAAGGMWDTTDRKPQGFGSWTHIGDPEYDAFLAAEIRHIADLVQGGGAGLVWLNAPNWNPVYTPANFMGRGPYPEADPARSVRYNEVLTATLAGRSRTQLLDLRGFLQSLPGGDLAPDVRADGVHLTQAGTRTVAQWLVPQLIATGQASPVAPADSTAPPSGDALIPTTGG
ncbi:MAG: acyltransferase [Microthrixaceae bacterium]|nr:acyltransferase [Microthrixaceae bacterium]